MSGVYTYPGVYIQELPSPVHAIAGVPTSIAAFVGFTASGIDNRAQAIYSFGDFQRLYGGLASNSEVSYAVQQFYIIAGSGTQAYVVRTPMHYPTGAVPYAQAAFGVPRAGVTAGLAFSALSSGQWANGKLLIDVDVQNLDLSTTTGDPYAFNLTVTNLMGGTPEYFPQLTLNSNLQNFVAAVVNDPDNGSQLVNVVTAVTSPPTALTVTGLLGAALTIATVNTALGGSATATTASADCSLTLQLPASFTPSTVVIKVIGNGSAIPQTVQGLASQLQTAINTSLAINVPGASVACSAAPIGTTGNFGIRVNALLPNQPDALISFSAPPTGTPTPNDASAALGLSSPTSDNVAHYALGTGVSYAPSEYQSTAATMPTGTTLPGSAELIGDPLKFTGIYALNKVPIFNLLSIPEAARDLPSDPNANDPKSTRSRSIRRRSLCVIRHGRCFCSIRRRT
jgi:hypothetical protein